MRLQLAALAAAGGLSVVGCIDSRWSDSTTTTDSNPEMNGDPSDRRETTSGHRTATEALSDFGEPTVEPPAGAVRGSLDATVAATDPVVDELPTASSGEIRRIELREREQQLFGE